MRLYGPLSIRSRLLLNTTVVVVALVVVFAMHFSTARRLGDTFVEVQAHQVLPEHYLIEMLETIDAIYNRMLEVRLAYSGAEAARSELETRQQELWKNWEAFLDSHHLQRGDAAEEALVGIVSTELRHLRTVLGRMMQVYAIYDPVEIDRIAREDWYALQGGGLQHLYELATMQRGHARQAYESLVQTSERIAVLMAAVLVGSFGLVAAFSICLNRHINHRIGLVEKALARVTTGDYEHPVPGIPGTEFGRIAHAINYTLSLLRNERDQIAALGRKTEAILSSIAEGIYGVDNDGKIVFVNAAACTALGYSQAELIGRSSHATLHHHRPDGTPYPAADCPMMRSRLGRETIHGDDEFLIRKDGSLFPIDYTCTPLVGAGDSGIGIVVFRDITERRAREYELREAFDRLRVSNEELKSAQSQLLQSEKMASIGQLAAGVAHEINNPVGFVNSNLGTLKTYVGQLLEVVDTYVEVEGQLPADPALQARLAQVRKQADLDYLREDVLDLLKESQDGLGRIKRIVADLKDFSHVGEVEWQEADLNGGLESTLNVVWNELKYKAEVVRELGMLPPVRCLAAQLNQVFMNLLVNAAQAIDERGTITIRTRQDGPDAVVEIADTGKGIPPELQQRIFEPFFTTKPVGKGTGLGLSIAWDIVRKHDGALSVASTPGVGTTFTVRIPVAGPAAEETCT